MAAAVEQAADSWPAFLAVHHNPKPRHPRSMPRWVYELKSFVDPARLRRAKAVRDLLASTTNPIDHLHFMSQLAVGDVDAVLRSGIRFSVTIDSTWFQTRGFYGEMGPGTKRWWTRNIAHERVVFDNADFVAVTSEWAGNSLIEDFGLDDARILHMPFPILGVGQGTTRIVDAETKVITFIGNDFERKGGSELVRWHQSNFANEAELHIVSAAPRPPWTANLKGVVWHGEKDNRLVRTEILPRATVLALPSTADLSPFVLTEAAAAGVPAVTSNLAGIPELVLHDKTGFCIDPSDEAGFIKALYRLLHDQSLNEEMGQAARQHYETNLETTVLTNRLFERISSSLK